MMYFFDTFNGVLDSVATAIAPMVPFIILVSICGGFCVAIFNYVNSIRKRGYENENQQNKTN